VNRVDTLVILAILQLFLGQRSLHSPDLYLLCISLLLHLLLLFKTWPDINNSRLRMFHLTPARVKQRLLRLILIHPMLLHNPWPLTPQRPANLIFPRRNKRISIHHRLPTNLHESFRLLPHHQRRQPIPTPSLRSDYFRHLIMGI